MKGGAMNRIFLALLPLLLWSANLNAQTPFYEDKTIRIVVGSLPGGPFDTWARTLAGHMGKYIPGNPRFIVQNMPGGGSMIAANYVYTVAKPDGLTLGSVQAALYLEQLAGRKEVQFDWAKFAWIGNPEPVDRIFFMRADTPYKTLEDIRKASEPPKCGSQAPGTVANYFPRLLEDALGLKLNVVTGYKGAADIRLAIERGEVHCYAFSVQGFFSTEPSRTWAKTGFVRVLIQGGKKRDPRLPDVPTIWELMDRHKTPEGTRRLVRVLLAPDELGRVLFGPPGIPADRVKTLSEAFMKAMSDPELLAEAKKRGLGVNPTGGEELEAMAKDLMAQPPEVIERMKKILEK